MQAQRRSCRSILREKGGTWTPRLLADKQRPSRSTPALTILTAEELVLCEVVWALGQEWGQKPHFGAVCACLVAAMRSWAVSRSAVGKTPPIVCAVPKPATSSGLTCGACCLQHVDMGRICADHQSMRQLERDTAVKLSLLPLCGCACSGC